MDKICRTCNELKSTDKFPIEKGYTKKECRTCISKTRSQYQLKYKRTKAGLIGKIYNNQRNTNRSSRPYIPTYSLSEFREWMLSQEAFHKLFSQWADSNYNKSKVPSCDRIDDLKGYSLDNIQIVTWEENLNRCYADRIKGKNSKNLKPIHQLSLSGELIEKHNSIAQAARKTGVRQTSISACRTGKQKSAGGFLWKD